MFRFRMYEVAAEKAMEHDHFVYAWFAGVESVKEDLTAVLEGKVTGQELREYIRDVYRAAAPLPGNHEYRMWTFADLREMPGDARVDFMYTPTYYITCILLCADRMHPEIMDDESRDLLRRALGTCAGRELQGYGYETGIENVDLFRRGGIEGYLRENPGACPAFAAAWKKAVIREKKFRESGNDPASLW